MGIYKGVEGVYGIGTKRPLLIVSLLLVIAAAVIPCIVLGYEERQLELCAGNLLVQDQFYTTSPVQTLFHSQAAAGTDTEAFAFGRSPEGGINLAQTGAQAATATDTGFFSASFSFLKFTCPTGQGYLHTSIGDPIVSRTPVFAGLILPQMIEIDRRGPFVDSTPPAVSLTPVNQIVNQGANQTVNQTAPDMSALNETVNNVKDNLTNPGQAIKKQLSSDVGVEDTVNIMAVSPSPTPAARPAPAGIAANATNATNATVATPSPTPEPATILPKSASLLVKPLSRQANKPFTETIAPDYNPRKATRSQVRNISGWDRLTTNVIGRSGIDSTYMNRTSYPSYINPWNVIKLADQFKVMSDSANMTRPGSYLQQRLWAL